MASDLNQTLLRTRGNVLIAAIPNAAADVAMLALGLIVVSDSAANAGGVSLPGPILDQEADWLWHQYVPLDAVDLISPDANSRAIIHRVEIDAKAMRKIAGDRVVVLMGEISASGFVTVDVFAACRFLLAH